MVFNVYNKEFQRLSLVDTFISSEWSVDYNGLGNFTLVLSETVKNVNVFKNGHFIKQQSDNDNIVTDCVMLITSVIYNDDRTMTIIGASALQLLQNRIIDKTLMVADAETAMRYAVSNFRPFEGVVLGEIKNYNIQFNPNFETTYTSVYDLCFKICEETGLGMRMLLDTKINKLVFDVYNGVERVNAVYSDIWGNLLSAKLTQSDINYKNFAFVAGQGRNEERVIVTVGDDNLQNFERAELFVDARDLQQDDTESDEAYRNRLIARGLEKLNENQKIFNVSLTIPDTDLYKKFNLGDKINVNIERYNLKVLIRVQGYTIKQVKNIQKLTLSLGVPILRR